MDIRDQSIGVVGAIFMHTPLGVSWLVLAQHSLCISWRVPPIPFFVLFFSLADLLYPTENVAGRHGAERASTLFLLPLRALR